MRRLWVPGIPFLLSLALSLSTAGGHLYWQDSGLFLAAVRELGILYPPGFALYVVLCKLWTLALGWVDFTYAVHLFSAVCAAGAAATIAVAARDLLESRGPVFSTSQAGAPLSAGVGASIGCLAAAGYTFWSAAILAKVYAFYYLILSLLIWRMIRADGSGRPRDFLLVAALVGLSWQAHPSALCVGPAVVLFVWTHRRSIGAGGLAVGTAVAAACAVGPALLLPALAVRDPVVMLGRPVGLEEWGAYLLGARFTRIPGAFGWASSRMESVGRYFWEEFLGVGSALVLVGLVRLARVHRRLLLAAMTWVLPVLTLTTLFKIEGQHDLWMVSAWIPVWLVAAIGMARLGRFRHAVAVSALAGTVWAVAANRHDLDQRAYTLAESFGHLQLDEVDRDAVLVLSSDDALASAHYLQRVKGVRPDVVIVEGGLLGWQPGWYEELLGRRHPFLRIPDYSGVRGRFPQAGLESTALGAFANANASRDHPLFFERPPAPETIRSDYHLLPAGHLLKLVPAGEDQIEARYWNHPVEAESLAGLFRRERGQFVQRISGSVRVRPEAYERRLLRDLLLARKHRADWLSLSATPEGYRGSAQIYESIVALEPAMAEDPAVAVALARAYYAVRRFDRAEPWLKKSVALPVPARIRAQLCCLLVDLCRASNRPQEARAWAESALAIPELPAELRGKLEPR